MSNLKLIFFPDFPAVNWVLQLDCPEDANTYIHRAGRTARYCGEVNSCHKMSADSLGDFYYRGYLSVCNEY